MFLLRAGLVAAMFAATLVPTTAHAVAATTYYVDADGDDSAAGTSPDSAWRSLAKVNATTFQPGDIIRFQGGDAWHGGLVIKSSGVTVTSYGQGRPLIAGDTLVDAAVLLDNVREVTVRGLEVTNGTDLSVSKTTTYRGIFAIAKDIGEVPGIVIADNYVHHVDGKGGPVIGKGGIAVGVRGNTTPTWYSGLRIEGNEVADINAYGISTFTTWCASCEIYSAETGIPAGEVSPTRKAFTAAVFRDNYVHDVTAGGITPQYIDDALVEGNTVDKAGSHLKVRAGNNAGIWWQGTNRITVQYNVVRRQGYDSFNYPDPVDGMAFDADMGSSNSLVQYNYSDSNAGGFFMCLISANNVTVRYNVSNHDHFRPFSIWSGCWNLRGYNNTIWGTTDTITRHRPDGTTFQQDTEAFVRSQSSSSNVLFNNIFYNPARATFDCRRSCDHGSDVPMNYSHNLYWDTSGSPVLPRGDAEPIVGDPRLAAPGTRLPESGRISREQLLTVLRAYTPAADSPARDAGLSAATAPATDVLGTAVPAGAPDLGAVQHPVKTHVTSNAGPHAGPVADGDPATSWTSTKAGGKIMIKYGEPRTIDGLHLAAQGDGPAKITVLTRDAAGEWVTRAEDHELTWSGDLEWLRIPFAGPVTTDEVRLLFSAGDRERITLHEVRGSLGKIAAASAHAGGNAQTTLGTSIGDIQAITDGNPGTSWASADNPKLPGSVSVTWSKAHTIDSVRLTVAWGQGQGPTRVDVQTRAADGTWVTQVADHPLTWQLNSTTPESPSIALPAPVRAHGIRLVVKAANLWWGHLAIYEFAGYSGTTPVVDNPGTDKLPYAGHATDGDPATTWRGPDAAGTGLQVDPGAPQTVSSITLTAPVGHRPLRIRVQALTGGAWKQVLAATDLAWTGDTITVPLPGRVTGDAFYVIVDRSTGGYDLAEVTLN
ncbi:discoidin domain-containing protein [Nonomuraea recticatena]|uniref:F5/8 type C domain-containing protein n=1 Tax=Nonomuraea recticatena TaxID=46178 RepID=A0ABP6F2X9_9ACTN